MASTAVDENDENALYKLLGVQKEATDREIKKAYYVKARKVHPDRCGNTKQAKENFQVLVKAYEILSDPEKRKLYDRTGCTDQDSDQFWEAYQHYRSAYPEITKEDIEGFEKNFRHSEDERKAVQVFYEKFEGDITDILGHVMCSRDEDIPRFIDLIDGMVDAGVLAETGTYKSSKLAVRTVKELDELVEENTEDIEDEDILSEGGEEEAEFLEDDDFIAPEDEVEEAAPEPPISRGGKKKKTTTKKKKKKKKEKASAPAAMDPLAALRAQILGRAQERHQSTVDFLAEKYGGGGNKSKKRTGKKRAAPAGARASKKKSKASRA